LLGLCEFGAVTRQAPGGFVQYGQRVRDRMKTRRETFGRRTTIGGREPLVPDVRGLSAWIASISEYPSRASRRTESSRPSVFERIAERRIFPSTQLRADAAAAGVAVL
jgi:hypothetical protein